MSNKEILFRKFGRLGVCLDCVVKDRKIRQVTCEMHHWIGQCGKLSRENAVLSNRAYEARQLLTGAYKSLGKFIGK